MACAEDRGDYYRVPPDLRDLNYGKFVEQGERRFPPARTTTRTIPSVSMSKACSDCLLKLDFIRDLMAGKPAHAID